MGGGGRLLRRSAAVALALVGIWALSLTADLSGFGRGLDELGQDPDFILSALTAELGVAPEGELTGWARLLVGQSAFLQEGQTQVLERLAQEAASPSPTAPDAGEEEDAAQTPLPQPEDGQVMEHTAVGRDDGNYLTADRVYLANKAGLDVDVAALAAAPLELTLPQDGPQILIMHSHGSEAYTQAGQDVYVESDPYRTTDCNQNVVRVGEEVAQVFRAQGFQVVHDTNLYDYPAYNGAYERSRVGTQNYLEQYPTIRLVLDIHRDALAGTDGTPYRLVSQEGGEKVAQVMLVVGSNDAGMDHPDWRENLALAVRLQLQLTQDHTTLARPITLRSSRYNQDLTHGSLLVEVGGHGNTLQDAIAGARLFAESTAKTLKQIG